MALDVVGEAEVRLVAQHDGLLRVWNRVDGKLYGLEWNAGRPRATLHGLSATCRVLSEDGASTLFPSARVHICRSAKCGAKFDNRVEPYIVHGVPLDLVAQAVMPKPPPPLPPPPPVEPEPTRLRAWRPKATPCAIEADPP
ncbi:MAG: hypothetical protein GY772_03995 [bacterium]|nr:hypothetical protein [bacterium]